MPKKYVVRLTDGERETLSQILKKRGVASFPSTRVSSSTDPLPCAFSTITLGFEIEVEPLAITA